MSDSNFETAAEVSARLDAVIYKNADALQGGFQAHHGHTPLDDLIEKEEGVNPTNEEVRQEAFHKLLNYFFADGAHPLDVVRRVYATVKALRPDLIGDMSLEDLAVLSGDGGRATTSARIRRIYNKLIEDHDGGKVSAWFQKSESTVEKYRQAQQGNSNRKSGARKGRFAKKRVNKKGRK